MTKLTNIRESLVQKNGILKYFLVMKSYRGLLFWFFPNLQLHHFRLVAPSREVEKIRAERDSQSYILIMLRYIESLSGSST